MDLENNETPEVVETENPPAPEAEETQVENHEDVKWLREELSRVRKESARYRTDRNALRDKFADAKTAEEYQAAVAEYEAKIAEADVALARERVARAHNLPDELAELLKGSTEDELKAHAQTLQKFARPGRGGDPRGGLDPQDEPDTGTASDAADALIAAAW